MSTNSSSSSNSNNNNNDNKPVGDMACDAASFAFTTSCKPTTYDEYYRITTV